MLKHATIAIAAIAIVFGCIVSATAQDQRAEMNKRIILKLFQDVNTNNVEGMAAALHPQYITHGVGETGLGYSQDVAGDRRALADIHAAFPGLRFTIDKMTAVADTVDVNFTVRGSFKGRGKMMGLDPTGKPFAVQGSIKYRLTDGKVVEKWANWDPQVLKMQIQQ